MSASLPRSISQGRRPSSLTAALLGSPSEDTSRSMEVPRSSPIAAPWLAGSDERGALESANGGGGGASSFMVGSPWCSLPQAAQCFSLADIRARETAGVPHRGMSCHAC